MRRSSLIVLVTFFLILSAGCTKIQNVMEEPVPHKFVFLYTNDEHGHFYEKDGWYKGAALYEMWEEEKKACPECTFYRLSGGDNYTGSAISSMFKGKPMAKIMSILGYHVSAVGNHEFDFGMVPFEKNRKESGMAYLSSNIIFTDLTNAFEPSMTFESEFGKFSVIGSTTEELKQISFAAHMKNIQVVKPEGPVGRELKKYKDNTDFQIVISHESAESARNWVQNLPIKPLIVFTGHEHKEFVKNYNDVLFIQTSKYLKAYARVEIVKKGESISVTKVDMIPLKKKADFDLEDSKKIKKITDKYLRKMEKQAGGILISAKKDFAFKSFQKLYACTLLEAYPGYQVAMSNPGAFRDEICKGSVRKSDIISMLPFQNRLVLSELPGKELIYNLDLSQESYCGAEKEDGTWFVGDTEIDPNGKYKVVAHEFIYSGGDYYRFVVDGAVNNITSKDWREPLEKYLSDCSKKGLDLDRAYASLMKKFNR